MTLAMRGELRRLYDTFEISSYSTDSTVSLWSAGNPKTTGMSDLAHHSSSLPPYVSFSFSLSLSHQSSQKCLLFNANFPAAHSHPTVLSLKSCSLSVLFLIIIIIGLFKSSVFSDLFKSSVFSVLFFLASRGGKACWEKKV